ncbi:MAG: sigma-70 family RNA polymerase sigma factor [Cyanosarcina radialis HA8281-LM2]|jgi:RNA polymerase sigma-70 factor (ECF subfamily)|nr:sigma-70 family RNA polymerase sigma factor [Cyanosarcina radialis HA8281-LM2]
MKAQQDLAEPAWLAQIAQQDRAALSQLYDRYHRIIYAVAFRVLNSAEEAEEVVIDVFSQVWRTANRYDPERSRVDSWLFMMTRSRALDRLRALQRAAKAVAASVEVAQIPFSAQIPDPIEDVLINERRDRVLAALQELPENQRLVLELAYYQGLTQAEIAARTGEALGTIKTRIRLGLSKLRGIIDSV